MSDTSAQQPAAHWQPDALLQEAAVRLGTEAGYLEWFAWPQIFPSTAGPGGGIGGCAMTTFQVLASREGGTMEGVKWCAGRWQRWRGEMQEMWR